MGLPERQRAEYLEFCELLYPFGVTMRDAVKFYLPNLHATNRTCNAAELVTELLAYVLFIGRPHRTSRRNHASHENQDRRASDRWSRK